MSCTIFIFAIKTNTEKFNLHYYDHFKQSSALWFCTIVFWSAVFRGGPWARLVGCFVLSSGAVVSLYNCSLKLMTGSPGHLPTLVQSGDLSLRGGRGTGTGLLYCGFVCFGVQAELTFWQIIRAAIWWRHFTPLRAACGGSSVWFGFPVGAAVRGAVGRGLGVFGCLIKCNQQMQHFS